MKATCIHLSIFLTLFLPGTPSRRGWPWQSPQLSHSGYIPFAYCSLLYLFVSYWFIIFCLFVSLLVIFVLALSYTFSPNYFIVLHFIFSSTSLFTPHLINTSIPSFYLVLSYGLSDCSVEWKIHLCSRVFIPNINPVMHTVSIISFCSMTKLLRSLGELQCHPYKASLYRQFSFLRNLYL